MFVEEPFVLSSLREALSEVTRDFATLAVGAVSNQSIS
jgi:hypothetical protein